MSRIKKLGSKITNLVKSNKAADVEKEEFYQDRSATMDDSSDVRWTDLIPPNGQEEEKSRKGSKIGGSFLGFSLGNSAKKIFQSNNQAN